MLAFNAADDAPEGHVYGCGVERRRYNEEDALDDVDWEVAGLIVSCRAGYITY